QTILQNKPVNSPNGNALSSDWKPHPPFDKNDAVRSSEPLDVSAEVRKPMQQALKLFSCCGSAMHHRQMGLIQHDIRMKQRDQFFDRGMFPNLSEALSKFLFCRSHWWRPPPRSAKAGIAATSRAPRDSIARTAPRSVP